MSFLGAQNSIALGVQGLIHIDTGVVGSTDYLLAKSLRFRSSASAYLTRTFPVAGNQTTWTWSGWVKRGTLGQTYRNLFGITNGSNDSGYLGICFGANGIADNLGFQGWTTVYRATTAVYRDPAAWYHIVLAVDTTQATAANRILMYVNGDQITSFSSNTNPTQNATLIINSAVAHQISRDIANGGYYDGEITEVNFVDGQALLPASFGATGANSQWLPKAYTGTYGTNGFYLPFTNTASTSTLVADSSGNANNWTPNNISLTAGSTYDSLTDVPTLTSTTVANYAVLNPLQKHDAGYTVALTNGNLSVAITYVSGVNMITVPSTVKTPASGKWYWEITVKSTLAGAASGVGVITPDSYIESTTPPTDNYLYVQNGNKYTNGTGTAYGSSYTNGDIIGVALDVGAGTITFYKNNTSQGTAFTGLAATTYYAVVTLNDTGSYAANFGQQPFTYAPPSGFLPLNTFNIAAGTVTTSGTFTGNLSTDGPFVFLNGTPTAMTINGNAVTFGTQADKLANGFKVRSSSVLYNLIGSNTYVATTVGAVFKYEDAQSNP